MLDNREQADLQDMMKDLLTHPDNDLSYLDKGILNNVKFTDAEMKDLRNAFSKISANESLSDAKKADLITNAWKINFKAKPPTMAEFLTPEYIGTTGESLYDYIKSDLIEFFAPDKDYFGICLYPHIRWGKTFLANLSLLFVAYHYYMMRDPHKFLGVSKASYNIIALVAFNMAKAHELMVAPMLNILSTSEKFYRCRNEEQLFSKMKEFGTEKVCYTTACTGSSFRIGTLPFKQISSTSNLLGLALLGAVASELAFFQQRAWSQDAILDLFNTIVGRIHLSFPNNYYARWILDSSPYDSTNLIEKYIIEDAPKDPRVMVRKGAVWEYQMWKVPEFQSDPTKTFPVFTGTESKQPLIFTGNEDLSNYPQDKIIDVPIDLATEFNRDLVKSLRDYAGIPSSAPDNLVNHDHIEKLFSPILSNIYTFIHAPANLPPENLIWDKIKSQFFYKVQNGKYEFYRHPHAPRFLSVDQSYATDATGISMCHLEMNKQGELVYIVDFTICIVPTKENINLEAIKFFIRDLRRWGSINLVKVSFDQFQSKSTMQYLERHGFDVIKQSVDISTEPYLNFIALMSRGAVKMGKNIIMKNNLKSLIMSRTKQSGKPKVDHILGDVPYNENDQKWEDSKMGINAKDLSDSTVGCVYLADQFGSKAPS